MSKSNPIVFFFRGLNSAGDDTLRLGPVSFGDYFHRIGRSFNDVNLIPVQGLGRGLVEEMGARALQFFENHDLFHSLDRKVHFFGHSMGGLIARYLAHQPLFENRLQSIITVGTPHLGLPAAVSGQEQSRPVFLIRKLIENRRSDGSIYYKSCRPDVVPEFNRKFPNRADIFYGSVLGIVDKRHLPVLLRWIDQEYNEGDSDGLVPLKSQSWGQEIGQFRLDHLEQIGLCQDISPLKRFDFQREYRRYSHTLRDYWHSFST